MLKLELFASPRSSIFLSNLMPNQVSFRIPGCANTSYCHSFRQLPCASKSSRHKLALSVQKDPLAIQNYANSPWESNQPNWMCPIAIETRERKPQHMISQPANCDPSESFVCDLRPAQPETWNPTFMQTLSLAAPPGSP